MNHKPKKCNGANKAKGFEGCGKEAYLFKFGLCKSCFMDWCFSTKEGNEYYSKQFIKAGKKKLENEKKKERQYFKEKHKSIQKLIQEARQPFHEFIRIRDANLACISCGCIDSKIWDAGHFYKAELYSGLIFDEENTNKQCRKCNTFLDGNENEYRKGFEIRFGIEKLNELDRKAIELRSYKYSREELIEIKTKYQNKVKELKTT